eukprot:SAG11_NODE_25429_length_357_cov_15.436293_1_plen_24_part_10
MRSPHNPTNGGVGTFSSEDLENQG